MKSSNMGYPRIGANREWKKSLELFWQGKLTEAEFTQQMETIRLRNLQVQVSKGIEIIPVNDFSLYDHMLDMSTMFGLVPKRFSYGGGVVPVSTYYEMARGNQQATACEMTKWFNTNYHYIVPEFQDAVPVLVENRPLTAYREAKEKLNIEGKPVFVGPYTFVKLSKGYPASQLASILETFVPLYIQIVQELQQEGVQWVQIDEPSLVTDVSDSDMRLVASIYEQLKQAAPKLKIWVQTYFESVEHYEQLVAFPVDAIGLDFVHGQEANLSSLEAHGFPANKVLAVGLVDGRNIWSSDYDAKLTILERICKVVPHERLVLQPSCSLLHAPVSVEGESKLDPVLRQALSFANEKLDEVRDLTQAINEDYAVIEGQMKRNRTAILDLNQSSSRNVAGVQQAIMQLQAEKELHSSRNHVFAERRLVQEKKWQLPFLPTTTIGSFPQSAEVRQARLKFRKGDSSNVQYDAFVREQIKIWIELQEQIGLDVLVHGEFERTDMVEFFGEKLTGFAFTQNGWVQSYGSRCVKPPVIYGDVYFEEPMTVEETVYAQTLTSKPVKGMLTGPITILNWSFVRDDITREQVAFQIALALREEVEALERAGIEMIQVDEPALREGLPLRRDDWAAYLEWSVLAFRISTASVKDTTQIHTHMCYCEFHDIIDSIQALDADVISIETSRSHGELIHSFENHTYTKGIGLGVYDIHSPRVPSVDEMVNMIERALKVLDPSLFWINPDCGLKTRGIAETVESLTQMVKATQKVRELRKED